MKHKCITKTLKITALVVCLLLVTSFTYTDITEEVRLIVIEHYGGGKIPTDVWSAESVEDILKALIDPYSEYLFIQDFAELINRINMELIGIGITADKVPNGILVKSVVDNSGAMYAGLKPGDIITSADGLPLSGKSLETCIQMLRGEEGTIVRLTIVRDCIEFTVDVVRSKLILPTVEWELINNRAGYIRITSFGENTSKEFASALNNLSSSNIAGYIIDLRNNSGGFIDSTLEIAGYFIEDKKAVSFKGASDLSYSFNAISQNVMINKPLIFLANQNSASASELLLAAVKDYKKGLIVGETTFGKGSMQDFFALSNNDILKLTVARFYSPFGNPVNKVGVYPDIQASDDLCEQIATLLLNNSGDDVDKTGFIKYSDGDMKYEINLKDARQEDNWQAFSRLLDGLLKSSGELSIGNSKGWVELPKYFKENPHMLFYADYLVLPKLVDVPVNNQFTVTFNKSCLVDDLSEGDIELISSSTGKRVNLLFTQIDDCVIAVKPAENLVKGQTYNLVINPSIKDITGHSMLQGAIVEVQVR